MSATRLIVPLPDAEPWPTLGPEVCDFIEDHLVHGPGDVLGEPARLLDEVRLFIYRAYEVYPRDHPLAGRRRFNRAFFSRRKGFAKTELEAWLAICELDPTSPVRCDGWRQEGGVWIPVGRPVRDPFIPLLSTTEEQTEELAYAAVREILMHCDLGNSYDVGLERVTHNRAPGRLIPVAGAPSAADGGRTTFQGFDETHLYTTPRLKKTHATMLRNTGKRLAAEPWSLETSTMYAPGEGSIAEETHQHAKDVLAGRIKSSMVLFDHRQADERRDLKKKRELLAAIKEASGDAVIYTNFEAVIDQLSQGQAAFCRFWLNIATADESKWLDIDLWDVLVDRDRGRPPEGTECALAFDGSYSRDSTVLIGATVEEHPYVWVEQVWERPLDTAGRPDKSWRTSRLEVDQAIEEAMERYVVLELCPDPPGWHKEIEEWEQLYEEVVVRFETKQTSRMGPACDDFDQAVADAELSHDGSEVIRRHLGNCTPEKRQGYVVISKEHTDSPKKIDAAVGAVVAYHRAKWLFTNRDEEDIVAFVV